MGPHYFRRHCHLSIGQAPLWVEKVTDETSSVSDDQSGRDQLPEDLVRLSWLLGDWEGTGRGHYPGIEDFSFVQQAEFRNDGRPFISYFSRTWLLNEDGTVGRALATESGFWRLPKPDVVELVLVHASGIAETWAGLNEVLQIDDARITSARARIGTTHVMRTETAGDVKGGERLYGLMDDHLVWTYDMAADKHPMQNHLWARLAPLTLEAARGVASPTEPIYSYLPPVDIRELGKTAD